MLIPTSTVCTRPTGGSVKVSRNYSLVGRSVGRGPITQWDSLPLVIQLQLYAAHQFIVHALSMVSIRIPSSRMRNLKSMCVVKLDASPTTRFHVPPGSSDDSSGIRPSRFLTNQRSTAVIWRLWNSTNRFIWHLSSSRLDPTTVHMALHES